MNDPLLMVGGPVHGELRGSIVVETGVDRMPLYDESGSYRGVQHHYYKRTIEIDGHPVTVLALNGHACRYEIADALLTRWTKHTGMKL